MKIPSLVATIALILVPGAARAVPVTGRVSENISSNASGGARVTLFTPDLRFFREARTDAGGNFQFSYIGSGEWTDSEAEALERRGIDVDRTQTSYWTEDDEDGLWSAG